MADSNVPITAGTGTNIDTRTTPGGDHRQVVALGNDGDNVAGVQPFGAVDVNIGSATQFYDSWSGTTLDTTDRWVVTNGATPSISGGVLTMPATVSTYNALRTRDTIKPNVGFTNVRNGITVEVATATGAGRFWGLGTPATTPSATSLVQDGVGFEIDQTTGALQAVTYAAGAKTVVATLTRPTDGAIHAYGCYFRVTQAYWFIDNLQTPVASASFPNVQNAELPAIIIRNNGAAFTGTPVFTNIAHLTADTAKQATTISDPVVGTRMARVSDPSMYTAPPAIIGQGFGAALNVNPNAIQKRTYIASRTTADAGAPAATTIVANTRKSLLQIHHLAAATTTKRIRRITVGALFGAAVQYGYEVYRVTAAPTGGTAVTPVALDAAESASTAVVTYNPTAGGAISGIALASATVLGAATGHATQVVYDWQESGLTKPLVIRAGVLEGFGLYVRGTGVAGPDPQIIVEYTEE